MTERQSRWLVVLVLFGQLVLLSTQVPDRGSQRTVAEAAWLRMVAPFARLVEGAVSGIQGVRGGLRTHGQLRRENEALREQLAKVTEERITFFGIAQDLRRMNEALRYEPPPGGPIQVADVVHVDYGSWLQTLILYAQQGELKLQQPVVTSRGLLGRVVVVSGRYAKVQLVTDRAARVGAMIERTRRQGIVRGSQGSTLEMNFVPLQEDVREGDAVVSAGIDGVFPRGLPIGTIASVNPGSELFHEIRIVPAVDFGRVDQVYLLAPEATPEELKDTQDADR